MEPMALGSPVGSPAQSPGSSGSNPAYLPGFLLGEATTVSNQLSVHPQIIYIIFQYFFKIIEFEKKNIFFLIFIVCF